MLGMKMMLESMGLDPVKLQVAVDFVVKSAAETHAETMRQGRVIDEIARKNGIDPAAFNAPVIVEN